MSQRKPSCLVSLIPFVVLVASMFCVIRFFGADALDGASQVSLLIAGGVAAAISILLYKQPWKDFEDSISKNIRNIASALLILILIGAISGSWMISGVVPTLIYYGMQIMTPGIFLFATCIISALVSLMTGSSWTTIATIGVALIGIGTAQGFSPGWTAGAIISGAYFGDKMSPLSDTTVLASSSAGTPLFSHIKYMMITTVPSFTIACIIFLIYSIFHKAPAELQTAEIADALKASFNISPFLLLVPLFTGFLIVKKVPALQTLFLAAMVAGLTALIAQPEIIHNIATGGTEPFSGLSFENGFKGVMVSWYGSTAIETGNELLNGLVCTSGINGMLSTIFLIICAVSFGGIMMGNGMLQSITEQLSKAVRSRTALVSSSVTSGIFFNMITGDQYLSIILNCNLFKKLYKELGYEPRLLSRSAEDSATVTSVLIPWNSCGMTQATVLKVATLDYLPYCFFNLISPLLSIIVAAIGYRIVKSE